VTVEYLGPAEQLERHCDRLRTALHSALGLRCEVDAVAQGEVKRQLGAEKRIKYKRILDLRK